VALAAFFSLKGESMKKKSSLWCLGLLSLLSLLYLGNGNPGFFGFLGFLPYFAIYRFEDERIEANIGKASRNAFLFSVLAGSAALVYIRLTGLGNDAFVDAFGLLLGGLLAVCLGSLLYYEMAGR
jgi:hypothetical protein